MPEPVRYTNPADPVTLLLHKPAGYDWARGDRPAQALLRADSRAADDASGIECLARHFNYLTPIMPLERDAAGLLAFTQDARLLRRMRDESGRIEEEFIVEVTGEIVPYGLRRLCHGLQFNDRNLPPIKVSWQSETRLRFALKGVQPGQIQSMCADVGLAVAAMKRIRIGRIPLAKLPAGEWRYLPANQVF